MSNIYNSFIDHLLLGRSPSPDQVREVCAELARNLRWELKRRGLSGTSPKLVGLDHQDWNDSVFAELAYDAYLHSFVQRLRGLQNQRKAGKDVRGLVLRNLRNFLTERQKERDPIGYFLFEYTCDAVRQTIEVRGLSVLNAPPPESQRGHVDGASLLGFGSGLAPVTYRERLDEIVPQWSDTLFPGLVTARTNALAKEIDRLADCIASLRDVGVEAFRLGDLVAALKTEMRRRWQQRVAEDLGEAGSEDAAPESEPTSIVRPDDEFDGEKRLAWIVGCIDQRIAALAEGPTRDLLFFRIWPFIRSCQTNGIPRPPWTVISRELDISRKRLPRLYDRLGEITRRCLELLGRPHPTAKSQDHNPYDPKSRSQDRLGEPIAAGASRRGR